MTKEMARLLVLTQVASDQGKGIDTLFDLLVSEADKSRTARLNYRLKDALLVELVTKISAFPQKDLHFFVTVDEENVAKYIVYFDIDLGDERLQVSFHTYMSAKKLGRFVEASERSRRQWDRGSSRLSAYKLGLKFGLVKQAVSLEDLVAHRRTRVR